MDELFRQFTAAALAQEWDQAIALSEAMLALDPAHAETRTRTAAVYGWRAGLTLPAADAANDPAIRDYSRAIALDPTTADWYLARGVRYADHGAADRALADFTQGITLAPQVGAFYYERGRIYQQAGDLAAARRDFAQVVALNHGYTAEAQAALDAL